MNHDVPEVPKTKKVFDAGLVDIAWCPGCGNFGILQTLKNALQELGKTPEQVCLVSGIGQAAKTPQYLKANFFNGLHGRALSPATAIKAANPKLDVIVTSGDGCMYGEGGNHFIHTIRRNPNITILVHDNMIYGLTKGQASPTSPKNMKTSLQFDGVSLEPFNPLAVAISLDASFVARTSIHDMAHAKEIIKQAIAHEGLSIVDIFQPCVTFNNINTYERLGQNTYKLEENYDVHNREWAFSRAIEHEKYPLGVFYISPNKKPSFAATTGVYDHDDRPLFERQLNIDSLKQLFKKPSALHQMTLAVKNIIQETPTVKTFVFDRPAGFTFTSGQYVMVGFADKRKIDGKLNVPMTISSSSHEDELMVTIKRNKAYTGALHDEVQVGTELLITGPLGKKLSVDQFHTKNIVILSGGSGITPFRSMLRYAVAKKLPHTFTVINANRNFEEIIFREELDRLSHEHENIFVMNTLDECDDAWCGEKGCICPDMIKKYIDMGKDTSYFLCGPPPMVKAMGELLVKEGVHASRIIKEDWEIKSKNDSEKEQKSD